MPGVLRAHGRQNFLDVRDDGKKVNFEDAPEGFKLRLRDAGVLTDTGVADEYVDATEMMAYGSRGCVYVDRIGDIHGQNEDAVAFDFFAHAFEFKRSACGKHEYGTGFGKCFGEAFADAGRCACNPDDFILIRFH